MAMAGPRMGRGGPPGAGGPKPSLRDAFVALRNPHFRSLWFSQAASFTGMQMQMVARGLLAYELSGTFTAVGVVMMAWGIPQLVLSLIGGAIADRFNKRNIIIIVQTGTGLLSLLVAVLITTGHISIAWLFVTGLFQGTFFAFNLPARQALVAELVPQRELMNAIALNNVAMNGTRIVAPAVAGVLIAQWGIDAAYYAQTFMYLFVLFFLFRLPGNTPSLGPAAEERGSVIHEIAAGLVYIKGSRTLLLLMLLAFVPTVLGMPYMTLLPGFAVDELGMQADGYGLLFTVSGIGAIVSSVALASMTGYSRKALLQTIGGAGFGLSLLALGMGAILFGVPGALVALLGIGLFATAYQTLNNTLIMEATRPEFYGRVMSVYMLTFSVFPLMSGPMGVLADAIGGRETFIVLGGGILAFMLLMTLLSPRYMLGLVAVPSEGLPLEVDLSTASREGREDGEERIPAAASAVRHRAPDAAPARRRSRDS